MPSTTSPTNKNYSKAIRLRDGSLLTEDNVSAVKPACHDGSDKELGTVGVLAGVSHGQETRFAVLKLEVFICETTSRLREPNTGNNPNRQIFRHRWTCHQ